MALYRVLENHNHEMVMSGTWLVNMALELAVAAQQSRALDAARRCPACEALLEEVSVYCDSCGTDTPRQ